MKIRITLKGRAFLVHSHEVLFDYLKMYCGGSLIKTSTIEASKYLKQLLRDKKIEFTNSKGNPVIFEILE
jgi:hypothetical protein